MHVIEHALNLLDRLSSRLDLVDLRGLLLGVVACIECHLVLETCPSQIEADKGT